MPRKKNYSQQERESESYYEQKLTLQHSRQILRFDFYVNNGYMHESKFKYIKLIDALNVIFISSKYNNRISTYKFFTFTQIDLNIDKCILSTFYPIFQILSSGF